MFDAFENDWLLLGEEMSSIGGPGDIHLKVIINSDIIFLEISKCAYMFHF